jgi:uncharacterized membrane protein
MEELEKQSLKTRKITVCAVMTALVFVVTVFVKIPVPASSGAYLNVGDIVIYICAYVLGGPLTALIAGAGSCLADLAAGSAVYALPTLAIKGIMGFAAGTIMRKQRMPFYILGCIAGGAVMTGGYAVFEALFFDTYYMLSMLPFNLVQWAGCVAFALIFYTVANNISKYFGFRSSRIP